MSPETPKIIDHVPTPAELAALSAPNNLDEHTTNFADPEQLAKLNADLVSAGLEPRVAPGSRQPVNLPAIETPVHEPYVEPDSERRLSGSEMDELRRQLGIGKYAVAGAEQNTHK